MGCTANTNSVDLTISAGTLSADLNVDPAAGNGLSVSVTGVKAPSNVTSSVTTATIAGTSGSFTTGFSGQIGPVLSIPAITNPSADRTMIGLFIAKSTGETINWNSGSIAAVSFQISIDGGTTWSTQDESFYNAVSGTTGYGCHISFGTFGPIAAGGSSASGAVQLRMFLSCGTGGGTILNSGDLDCRVLLINQ